MHKAAQQVYNFLLVMVKVSNGYMQLISTETPFS
jgi:hypothetical protein